MLHRSSRNERRGFNQFRWSPTRREHRTGKDLPICPLDLEGITIYEPHFTRFGGHEHVGLVYITHDNVVLMQTMKCSCYVPCDINQALPCSVGKMLISIIRPVEKMNALSCDSWHKKAHGFAVTEGPPLRPCGDLPNSRQVHCDLEL